MRWKLLKIFIIAMMITLLSAVPVQAKELRILFTHDMHSYLDPTIGIIGGKKQSYGGAAKLADMINENRTDSTLIVDGGDYSMGTLYQTGFTENAYELRMLGRLGYDVTTFGNHEFDLGGYGLAQSLDSARRLADEEGIRLPEIVQSNIDFAGQLTPEQQALKTSMEAYGVQPYVIKEVNGIRVAFFGLEGIDSLECAPTSGQKWTDYIEAAQKTVSEIGEKADVIICLSHAGTDGSGDGEDVELIKKVSGIDVLISGHSHTAYPEALTINDTILGSSGCYLQNLGLMDLEINTDPENGNSGTRGKKLQLKNYKLLPIDETVPEDPSIREELQKYKQSITDGYLRKYAGGGHPDDIIAFSETDFISLDEMQKLHEEFNIGNLIADSYMYEARANGINDIDVALVGLGTIRGTIMKGPVKLSDAFEICSLGAGSDGSAGHPLIGAYITGAELKLFVELDASAGPMVSYIKMSYSGLEYRFNEDRMLLDRVTDIHIVRPDGTREEIDDKKLYKVSCNMYAANMLGMLNGLTNNILTIVPKNADGTPIEDMYTAVLKNKDGQEIKEWVAFRNYIESLGTITEDMAKPKGRKVRYAEIGIDQIRSPGATTIMILTVLALILFVVILILNRHGGEKKKK